MIFKKVSISRRDWFMNNFLDRIERIVFTRDGLFVHVIFTTASFSVAKSLTNSCIKIYSKAPRTLFSYLVIALGKCGLHFRPRHTSLTPSGTSMKSATTKVQRISLTQHLQHVMINLVCNTPSSSILLVLDSLIAAFSVNAALIGKQY